MGCISFETIKEQVSIVFDIPVENQLSSPGLPKKDWLEKSLSFLVFDRENETIGRILGTLGNCKTRGFPSGIGLLGQERFLGDHGTHKKEIVFPNLE